MKPIIDSSIDKLFIHLGKSSFNILSLNLTLTYGAVENRPTLSFCCALLEPTRV